jgi:ATP-dependent Lon protease
MIPAFAGMTIVIKCIIYKGLNLRYPILSLNGITIQPGLTIPIFVDKPAHLDALFDINGKTVILGTHKSRGKKSKDDNLLPYGTLANVLQVVKTGNAPTVQVTIQTIKAVKISDIKMEENQELSAEAEVLSFNDDSESATTEEIKAKLVEQIKTISRSRKFNYEQMRAVLYHNSLPLFIDATIAALNLDLNLAQQILIAPSFTKKLTLLSNRLDEEISHIDIDNSVKSRVGAQISKAQREAYLNEKMRAIQKELGEDDDNDSASLKKKIEKAKLPADVLDKVMSEFKKLRNLPPMSAEGSVIKNWLDEILALPWNKSSETHIDLSEAETIMNEDHDGLDKIKERILEHLAVVKKTGNSSGTILCFVGPPGVGKTSLGKSIARAMGRKYARISLGGVSDEAHFRGHRKTYIGSQPGRIIDTIKRSGVNNPLIVLDEIDKMGRDYRGDPEAALLEILDPEQNKTFRDHYLEVDFDLSQIMFVATANSHNLSRALRDRMEIINLSGYVEDEKIKIARNHLINKAAFTTGVDVNVINISDDALKFIIRYYTREAGVRELSRLLEKLMRKALRYNKYDFSESQVEEWLGVRKFDFGKTEEQDAVGLINGLAWSEVGGDLLQLEAITMPGKGKIILTGHLGDVMKESMQIAKSVVQSMAAEFGISDDTFEKTDIHIHALDGAVPKDGPSAGLALCTVILSAMTKIPVRRDIAMTGEISLHGKALPIGGLREKLLGARRGGVKMVLIPEENRKDMADIPEYIYAGMELKFVKDIREVIDAALTQKPMPVAPAIRISDDAPTVPTK